MEEDEHRIFLPVIHSMLVRLREFKTERKILIEIRLVGIRIKTNTFSSHPLCHLPVCRHGWWIRRIVCNDRVRRIQDPALGLDYRGVTD